MKEQLREDKLKKRINDNWCPRNEKEFILKISDMQELIEILDKKIEELKNENL